MSSKGIKDESTLFPPQQPKQGQIQGQFAGGTSTDLDHSLYFQGEQPEIKVPKDIDIARAAHMKPILDVVQTVGIPPEEVEVYGKYKAKLPFEYIDSIQGQEDGKLILVTAITPTKAGEGKTTTSVGLADGLCHIGKNAIATLR